MATSTSFRISDAARRELASRAEQEGLSATSLLEQLILEGIAARDHPGIIHRGPATERRAALAGGPDVWEVVARLQELEGPEERRVALLSDEIDLHPRLIRLALGFAASHPDDVETRIARQRAAQRRSQQEASERARLLA